MAQDGITKISERGQVVIPSTIRSAAGTSAGDLFLVHLDTETGDIILSPQITIGKSQSWFWTESWQKKERQVEEDIKKGRIEKTSSEDLHKELES